MIETSRRRFLEGLLSLTFLNIVPFLEKVAAKQVGTEQAKELERLKKLLEAYESEDLNLSIKDIGEILKPCLFVRQVKVNALPVGKQQDTNSAELALKGWVSKLKHRGEIGTDPSMLNVVPTDFDAIGVLDYAAFYNYQYDVVFINQTTPEARKSKTERMLIEFVVRSEYELARNALFKMQLSERELSQKMERLNKWVSEILDNPQKHLEKLEQLFLKHADEIAKHMEEYRKQELVDKVMARTNLPHEAFHHFYSTMLGKDGYEGPSMSKLLAMAIQEEYKRYKENDGIDYVDFRFILKHVDNIDDTEELKKVCEGITKKYNLTSHPKKPSPDKWRALTDKEKNDYFTQKIFATFLDEYLARVFNGAVGNTPKNVQKLMESINSEMDKHSLNDLYHDPTLHELQILSEMRWHGKPILKIVR